MPTLFAQRFADIARPVLETRLGELVTIARGAATTAGVLAIVSEQQAENQKAGPGGTVVTEIVDRIWIVRKSLYLFGGVAVEPRTGDRWTDVAGMVWEVLPSIAGPAVVSYAGGLEWEVKTKKVV